MKLEVGMYVRTKDGISKIENISPNEYDKEHDYIELENFVFDGLDTQAFFTTDKILKASHNIIDLIEVGDYVNGYKVSFKGDDYQPFVQCDYPVEKGSTNHYRFYEKAIYSIVTKEQFESMKYSLEG